MTVSCEFASCQAITLTLTPSLTLTSTLNTLRCLTGAGGLSARSSSPTRSSTRTAPFRRASAVFLFSRWRVTIAVQHPCCAFCLTDL